jgi:selenocysteine lyase/cysteine desulfurase
MKKLGVSATSRMSIGMYNTKEDIDELAKALAYAIKLIGVNKGR